MFSHEEETWPYPLVAGLLTIASGLAIGWLILYY